MKVKPVVVTLTGCLAATVRREATEIGIPSTALARHAISLEMATTTENKRQARVSWKQFTELEQTLESIGIDADQLTSGGPIAFRYYASAYKIDALAFGSGVTLSIVRLPVAWRRRDSDQRYSKLVTLIESFR